MFASSMPSILNFYPRPPRGGRRTHWRGCGRGGDFYPRPPRGGRPVELAPRCLPFYFYPRPPRGGRRTVSLQHFVSSVISIHALREEGDSIRCPRKRPRQNFYPRPPRGGRPQFLCNILFPLLFLSTPSARRATQGIRGSCVNFIISIHALREEGDSKNRDKISIFKQIIQHSARI